MKRILVIVASALFLIMTVASCKTQHLCPAYGKKAVKPAAEKIEARV